MLETTAAIMPSRDFDETAAFYAKFGFKETGRWEDHQYMILACDRVELHFFGHKGLTPESSDHGVYIRSSDVDAISATLEASDIPTEGIPRYVSAEDKDWGMREAVVLDPNGNLLRIGQYLDDG